MSFAITIEIYIFGIVFQNEESSRQAVQKGVTTDSIVFKDCLGMVCTIGNP
jgi:hypothetical protein